MKINRVLLLLLCLIPSQVFGVFGMASLVFTAFSFVIPGVFYKYDSRRKLQETEKNFKNAVLDLDHKKITKIIDEAQKNNIPLDINKKIIPFKEKPWYLVMNKEALVMQSLSPSPDDPVTISILFAIIGRSFGMGHQNYNKLINGQPITRAQRFFTVKALIKAGADYKEQNMDGSDGFPKSPFIYAIDSNNFELVQYFLSLDGVEQLSIESIPMDHALNKIYLYTKEGERNLANDVYSKEREEAEKIAKFLIKKDITLNKHFSTGTQNEINMKKLYKIYENEVKQQRWQNGLLNKKIFNDFEIKYK